MELVNCDYKVMGRQCSYWSTNASTNGNLPMARGATHQASSSMSAKFSPVLLCQVALASSHVAAAKWACHCHPPAPSSSPSAFRGPDVSLRNESAQIREVAGIWTHSNPLFHFSGLSFWHSEKHNLELIKVSSLAQAGEASSYLRFCFMQWEGVFF